MKNKQKLVLIIIILLIGTAFLIAGIVFNYFSQKKEVEEKNPITLINDTADLVKEHCLDNLCIKDLNTVNDMSSMNVVNGTVINNSNELIEKGYVKIIFKVNEKNIELHFYHGDIEPGATYPLELQHNNKKIINAIDYLLEYPTDKEINEYEKAQQE